MRQQTRRVAALPSLSDDSSRRVLIKAAKESHINESI